MTQTSAPTPQPLDRLIVWIAVGFGSGWFRPGPGTWGSLVGVAWTLALLCTGNPWIYGVAALAFLLAAVPVCTAAERLLGRHDPSEVVLDEIVAVPLAFGGYASLWIMGGAGLPPLAAWSSWWPAMVAAFLLFRLFDIWKPWPIRRIQALPGGWGIVLDDAAAGILAGLLTAAGTWVLFLVRLAKG
jgi:phosphatidylglycerophosphatase A